jgi:phosphate transport system substrate-binding protein
MNLLFRRLAALFAAAFVLLGTSVLTATEAAALDKVTGSGSTYVGPAMADWQNGANSRGIPVNYATRGSPTGVNQYGDRTVDFAGTEAEITSLIAAGGGGQSAEQRGYQYVPDVAGAVAVMYNVTDAAGNKVGYLHLTREVIGRIFTRDITRWNDPAISATNGGKALPDQPITLLGRTGQSGTTALFYDFVAHSAPGPYKNFVQRNEGTGIGPLPEGVRPIQLPYSGPDADFYKLFADSEQIAQAVGKGSVPFSIGYDEFSYALRYQAPTVWVENQAHQYTQPFAENIAAALTRAELRPDLSQKLDGVYANSDPKTYPISAYSYLMIPCATGRDTCRGGYDAPGKTDTITGFLDHIACDGQITMARIGYSPLPPNLSQEMMNSSARLTGKPAKQLTAANCNNPTFHGGLGAGATSPPDPFEQLGGVGKLTGNTTKNTAPAASSSGAGTATMTASPDDQLANGGSKDWQDPDPAAYDHGDGGPGFGGWATLVLFAVIAAPLLVRGLVRKLRGT